MAETRRRLKTLLGVALGGLLEPPAVSALYLTLLSTIGLVAAYGDERVQGVSVRPLRSLIESGYRDEVLRVSALAVGLSLILGALLGAAAGLVVRSRERLFGVEPSGRLTLAARSLAVAASAHAVWVLADAARRPALYEDWLYARGSLGRVLHVMLSDRLGSHGVIALGWLALAAWFFAPARRRLPIAVGRIRELWTSQPRAPRTPVLVAALSALVVVALVAARLPGAKRPDALERPNVLLIGVDSLRADHFDPSHMPELSRFIEHGTRFDRAYVSLPRTFPSWTTLLTGRYPHHHGIRSMFPTWAARSVDFRAVPGAFARAGFKTAVVGDFAADIFRRIELGFAEVDTPTFNFRELVRVRVLASQPALLPLGAHSSMRRLIPSFDEIHDAADPELVTEKALVAIDRAADKPFFVTAFYSGAHFPYAAPYPYGGKFGDPSYRGRFKYEKSNVLGQEQALDEADVRQVRALYDGAVRATDAALAQLLAGLESRGLSKSTIVVVTADHGEALYEHGRSQGHGDHLFGDEVTHVPLLIMDPRRARSGRVTTLVRDVDLAPTLYELGGVEPASDLDGRSLVPALDGKPLLPELAFGETGLWFTERPPDVPPELRIPYPDLTGLLEIQPSRGDELSIRPELEPLTIAAKHRMVRDERYKLVYVPTRAGARYFLFDTLADPAETRNVKSEQPEVFARLERELFHFMLQDRKLERRGELVVPRSVATGQEAGPRGLRVEDVQK